MIVLAIDNQISLNVVNQLKKHYDVALWAGTKADEDWVDEALALGATVFISPDLDIPNILDRFGADDVLWIDVPQNMPSGRQFEFLMSRLKKVRIA